MRTLSRAAILLGGAAMTAGLAVRPARAQGLSPVRSIAFFSTTTLPLWVAQEQGYFARERIALSLTAAPGSSYEFQHLMSGDFDFVSTAVDNMIALDEGQGDVAFPAPPDFVAVLGSDRGFLSLYARPEVRSFDDLRGKTFPADAAGSGYALLLRRMLDLHGLEEPDYRIEAVGGSLPRLQKMQSSPQYAATLLSPPYDLQAKALGFRLLGTGADAVPEYQASATVARRSWLATNDDVTVRYIRALLSALDWIFDPRNSAAAIALLAERTKLAPAVAAATFPSMVDPKNGLLRHGEIGLAGMQSVLALRNAYGVPHKDLNDPHKYYDDRYWRQATGSAS